MKNFSRLAATIGAIVMWVAIEWWYSVAGTLELGRAAGIQFSPSNSAYMGAAATFGAFRGGAAILTWALIAVLALLWWRPLKKLIMSLALLGVLFAPPAKAYYDKTDYTEAYTILPNESAFWIPDVGDNKSDQAQFNSEDYLQSKKIAAKRFVIPHAKLSGSGSFFDFYVPAGRLIIVDRTPYSREWVASEARGTSNRDEGFPCQTKEGLNITAGVSIGVSVSEANAAKFLYRFGVIAPEGKRADPAVIFASVYYGRSLSNVMDDVGRKKIQTLVCEQISARTFDKANEETNAIMVAVRAAATDYLAGVGITLEFLGWADTFTFDKDVQRTVNEAYTAAKLSPLIGVLQATTQLEVLRGLSGGLDKHGLPIVVTPDMLNALSGMGRALTGNK